MNQIDKLIAIATADLGYKESPSNSNKTKFGKWYGMDGQPWCMMAVQYWFNQVGLSPLIPRTASCTDLMKRAKSLGQFHTSGFRRGDIVLFDFNNDRSQSEHVGIITEAFASRVSTIEGNTSLGSDSDGGEVMERMRNNNLIIGVFRPKYEEEEMVKRYNTAAELPAWAKPTIEKLITKGYLQGDGGKLDLSEDMVRMLVINDRAGLYK